MHAGHGHAGAGAEPAQWGRPEIPVADLLLRLPLPLLSLRLRVPLVGVFSSLLYAASLRRRRRRVLPPLSFVPAAPPAAAPPDAPPRLSATPSSSPPPWRPARARRADVGRLPNSLASGRCVGTASPSRSFVAPRPAFHADIDATCASAAARRSYPPRASKGVNDAGADQALALGLADVPAGAASACSTLEVVHERVEVVVLPDDDGTRGRREGLAPFGLAGLVGSGCVGADAGSSGLWSPGSGARARTGLGCGVLLRLSEVRVERALVGEALDPALPHGDLQRGVDEGVAVDGALPNLVEGIADRRELPVEAFGLVAKARELSRRGPVARPALGRPAPPPSPPIEAGSTCPSTSPGSPPRRASSRARRRGRRGVADHVPRELTLPSGGDAEPPEELVVPGHRPDPALPSQ